MTADRAGIDVFISYRRDDAPAHAGRLYDRLVRELGESHVFMDVDSIGLGVDWMEALRDAVTSCDVLLAVIGRDWLDARDERGDRRLDNPADYVRFEIETALDRGVPVVPILVDRAERPPEDALPGPLRRLRARQELRIDDTTFQSDAGLLVDRLRRGLAPGGRPPGDAAAAAPPGDGAASRQRDAAGSRGDDAVEPRPAGGARGRRPIAIAGVALALLAAVAVLLVIRPDGGAGGGGALSERQAVDRVAEILEFSAIGRQARLDERWDEAVDNRQATVERVRALQDEDTPIGEDVDLLADAAEASLAAVEAYRECGGAGCAPDESRAALSAKRAFLARFNPRARRYLNREWGPGDF